MVSDTLWDRNKKFSICLMFDKGELKCKKTKNDDDDDDDHLLANGVAGAPS